MTEHPGRFHPSVPIMDWVEQAEHYILEVEKERDTLKGLVRELEKEMLGSKTVILHYEKGETWPDIEVKDL